MIVIDARPSTNDDDAQTIKLSELASTPAINPTTPSTPIHPSDAHDNRRARRAARYQPASRLDTPAAADGENSGSSVVATTGNTTRGHCWLEAEAALRRTVAPHASTGGGWPGRLAERRGDSPIRRYPWVCR